MQESYVKIVMKEFWIIHRGWYWGIINLSMKIKHNCLSGYLSMNFKDVLSTHGKFLGNRIPILLLNITLFLGRGTFLKKNQETFSFIICWHSVSDILNVLKFLKHMLKHFLWNSLPWTVLTWGWGKVAGRVRVTCTGRVTKWRYVCHRFKGHVLLIPPTVLMVQEHGNIKYFTFISDWSASGIKEALNDLNCLSSLFLSIITSHIFYITCCPMSSAFSFGRNNTAG